MNSPLRTGCSFSRSVKFQVSFAFAFDSTAPPPASDLLARIALHRGGHIAEEEEMKDEIKSYYSTQPLPLGGGDASSSSSVSSSLLGALFCFPYSKISFLDVLQDRRINPRPVCSDGLVTRPMVFVQCFDWIPTPLLTLSPTPPSSASNSLLRYFVLPPHAHDHSPSINLILPSPSFISV